MKLAAQYYRPPFPNQRHWSEDFELMKDAGLDAVYLWACWGWIEPAPGHYRFDDYDVLVRGAREAGLEVIINVIAEIQPFWIHRVIPDSRMVDHMGRDVVSSVRRECNVGLTPGGCTDHPEVRERMGAFLAELTSRYAGEAHLLAWDIWNETRWAVNGDGFVCQCAHTLVEFRRWLAAEHTDLDGLNQAWHRRYTSWEDVLPGKLPGRTFTEMMEFEAFLTARANRHMRFRSEIIRSNDPAHLVVAHAANPATHAASLEFEQAISRGNDWDHADVLDGFGGSLFPAWPQVGLTNTQLGVAIECSRSAAQDKVYWVGELQGGSARGGIQVNESVSGIRQQRWVWTAFGRGAKALSFWCWRDEVFGREASGFGFIGDDGFRDDRLAALRGTRALLDRHRRELDEYRPDPARVAVVFEPTTFQLDWAANGPGCDLAQSSLHGYLESLERLQIPYDVLESSHRESLTDYACIFLPWPLVVNEDLAADLLGWVDAGGVLVTESEVDGYDALGFYRSPEERPFANALGIVSRGRRVPAGESLPYRLSFGEGIIPVAEWAEAYATDGVDDIGVFERPRGRGRTIALGTFPGLASRRKASRDFDAFVLDVVGSCGAAPPMRCTSHDDGRLVQWRTGRSGELRLLFVSNAGEEALMTFDGPLLDGCEEALSWTGDGRVVVARDADEPAMSFRVPADGHVIVAWTERAGR